MDTGTWLSVAGAIISLAAALYAGRALRQARLARLYSSFDLANQVALAQVDLLYEVHGLDRSVPEQEARYIAYLSTLLNGYQNYWSDTLSNDFSRAAEKLKESSTFLNRVLAIPANQRRWNLMKDMFYGEVDRKFMAAVDDIIAHENRRNPRTS
jgi:hypothetical protein